jgi:hypothetical protein
MSQLSVARISPSFDIIVSYVYALRVAELSEEAEGYFISWNFVDIIRHVIAISYKSFEVTFGWIDVYISIMSTQWWIVADDIYKDSPTPLIQSTSYFLF